MKISFKTPQQQTTLNSQAAIRRLADDFQRLAVEAQRARSAHITTDFSDAKRRV